MYGRSLYPKQEDGNHPAIHSHSTALHRKENLSLTDVFLYQHDRASSKQKPSFQQHVDGNNPAIGFASGDTHLHQQRGDGNRSTANQQKPSFQQHVDGNNPAIGFASGDTQLHQQRGDGNRSTANQQKPSFQQHVDGNNPAIGFASGDTQLHQQRGDGNRSTANQQKPSFQQHVDGNNPAIGFASGDTQLHQQRGDGICSTANQQKPSSLIRPQHKDKDMGGVVALGTYQPDYSLDSDIRQPREITRAHVECHSREDHHLLGLTGVLQ